MQYQIWEREQRASKTSWLLTLLAIAPAGLFIGWGPLNSFVSTIQTIAQFIPLSAPENANWRSLFEGGSQSVVAIAIGTAEGTRTPDGGKTMAYTVHPDPGNGVWNQGTFSFQHQARSPQQADHIQLQWLRGQVEKGLLALEAKGVDIDQAIALNLADLLNQSPAAAAQFPDAFLQCQQSGEMGSALILCARVASYGGDAPGLVRAGVTIEADQHRRMEAISRVLEKHQAGAQTFITPTSGKLTYGYGWRADPFTGERRFHNGLDIAAPSGTPILAASSGRVRVAGDEGDGYGLKVVVDHDRGYQTLYAHASKLLVTPGQWVTQGAAIALMGSTGRSTGPHLHFEIIKTGQAVDPAPYLQSP